MNIAGLLRKHPERNLDGHMGRLPDAVYDRKTIRVKLDNVAAEMSAEDFTDRSWIEFLKHEFPLTPPFEDMWFEWSFNQRFMRPDGVDFKNYRHVDRFAVLMKRTPGADDSFRIHAYSWVASEGEVFFAGVFNMYLDQAGLPIGLNEDTSTPLDEERNWFFKLPPRNCFVWLVDGYPAEYPAEDYIVGRLRMIQCVVCVALSRFHCYNIKLRLIDEPSQRFKNKPIPMSVWRELVIDKEKTRVLSTGRNALADRDSAGEDIRLSWVRGHYRDYRRGAGLFGNPKLRRLWFIPEFRKGNPALGEVIPSYAVK